MKLSNSRGLTIRILYPFPFNSCKLIITVSPMEISIALVYFSKKGFLFENRSGTLQEIITLFHISSEKLSKDRFDFLLRVKFCSAKSDLDINNILAAYCVKFESYGKSICSHPDIIWTFQARKYEKLTGLICIINIPL